MSLAIRHGSELSNPTPRRPVVGFMFQNPWHPTWTKTIVLSSENITIFWPNPTRSCRYLTISRPYLEGPARSWLIRPDFGLNNETLDLNRYYTKSMRPELKNSSKSARSASSQIFNHPNHSGRVWVGHKLDPVRFVDSPNSYPQVIPCGGGEFVI